MRSERRQGLRHAVRVGLGLLVPGCLLLATGHPALMVYAAFGSFTGMYGRGETHAERLRHQLHGGGMLVTGVALGSLLAHAGTAPVVLVAAVAAFATIGSLVADRLRLSPAGPFFGIFALGATAMIGPGLVSWWAAVAICAGTAALAIVLGLVTLGRGAAALRRTSAPAGPWITAASVVHAVRYAVATCLAGGAGLAAGVDHANWAMASAAVPLAVVATGDTLALRAVVDRAALRVAGTLGGLLVTGAILLPRPGTTVLAVAVIALLFPTELFMARSYGIALGFFTPLIMVMTDLAAPSDPASMLAARAVDTLIGVTAAVVAAALVRRPARGD